LIASAVTSKPLAGLGESSLELVVLALGGALQGLFLGLEGGNTLGLHVRRQNSHLLLQRAAFGLDGPALGGKVGLGLGGRALDLTGDILSGLGELHDRGAIDHHDLGLGRIGQGRGDKSGACETRKSECEEGFGHLSIL